jgi:glycosyltransferase involved in cell wall biosynthesis
MKVAVFGHSSELAGAELSLFFCVKRMLAAGFEVIVYLQNQGPLIPKLQELEGNLEIKKVRLRWWMSKRGTGLVGALKSVQALIDTFGVIRALRQSQPDVVLTISSVTPAPIFASHRLGITSILTLGESLSSNPTLGSVIPKPVLKKLLSQKTSLVLACSEYVARQFGHPSELAYPEIEEFLVKLPLPKVLDTPKLVMLGSYSSEKGQDLALEVANELAKKGFTFSLDFYGWGSEKFILRLQDYVARHNLGAVVSFRKQTKDVFGVLESATLSLVFSRNEAFGKVTLESLSQGTPVIGLDFGGTSEILRFGGGVLVGPDPNQIADEIIWLCSNGPALIDLQFKAISNKLLYEIESSRIDIVRIVERAYLDKIQRNS